MSTNRSRQPGQQARQGRPAARQGRPAARQSRPRPLPPGNNLFTPEASPARQAVEQRSAISLLWLHQAPRWLLPLLAVALLVTGLAAGGWIGGLALAGVAAVLGWLAALSWPRLSGQGRLLRVAAVTAVLVLAALRTLR